MGSQFPVGYLDHLHPDTNLNFQLNRLLYVAQNDQMKTDVLAVAPKLTTYDDWTREFQALAEQALAQGQTWPAAQYLRSAAFFMFAGDPRLDPTRRRFLDLACQTFGITSRDWHRVPYEGKTLAAFRLTPAQPRGTYVWFGGFDGAIEEFFPLFVFLRETGYDVVAFDGPGMGHALEDEGIPMTPDWHKPVGAVLDYFGLEDVTLQGQSLGGCLVIRAAAFEPRVKRVIANDILYDLHGVAVHLFGPLADRYLEVPLETCTDAGQVNRVMARVMEESMLAEWVLRRGMHVFGAATPYDCLEKMKLFTTKDVSHLVTQDVLVFGASEDHFIPLSQFYRQIEALKNVSSLTARLFTRAEQAQNHCQLGNLGLGMVVTLDWLESMAKRDRIMKSGNVLAPVKP